MKGDTYGYDDYLSPFTWRYGSPEMRRLFSERRKRATWRKVWLALAEAQGEMGLLSKEEVDDISSFSSGRFVNIGKAHALERQIKHDLMAELRVFAGQAKKGGGKLHLGATSMDVEDNADVLTYFAAFGLLLRRMAGCLAAARAMILRHKGTVCMAWTHLQPAEPTTLGYRFANYAQDLVIDVQLLEALTLDILKGKGVKGAVGTSASFQALLGGKGKPKRLEKGVMRKLGLESFDVSTQTYPRKVDFLILSALASVAQSCHKFGLDLRIMQSPAFGELSEPMGSKQVGSSAMPFKRNPVSAERMCSLARLVASFPVVGFMNAANSILERTLDDSAGRRVAVPEAFLAVDECLTIYEDLMRNIVVYPEMIKKNLEMYGPFAGTEAVLMKLVDRGGDRQRAHETIRVKSFEAWDEVMKGRPNPLEHLLAGDRAITSRLDKREIHLLMDAKKHIGDAPERCDAFVKERVEPILAKYAAAKGRQRRF
ncbi:MAG: adenylosuccinate lyase [Thaumarchaeota archaeon]|nr:adenylosuccinate lyase [Nitrososphaerota archaeon]